MPRKEKEYKYHFIYRTTNTKNSKFYIGMHSTDNLDDGYFGSGKRLRNSIRKHGKEFHVCEILEYLPDRSSLKDREKEIIDENLLLDPLCLNLCIGGAGGNICNADQHKEGARIANLKNWKNPEFKKYHSLQVSKSMISKWKNIDYREKLTGKNFVTFKEHTEATKKKISDSMKNKQNGNKNSQFGTLWINKDEICKKIMKEEIKDYINQGWRSGRK
jgi:hypothetical protein